MIKWLENALFYEIYPQSFRDSNADGIGDINGIIEKLDYIQDLGCNAIWINPCFDSPFIDAGYDVRNYYKVAPRYGTNEDLKHLFEEAHKRDMHVILDLVPGHTSNECTWFRDSCKAEKNAYTDRYIWTDSIWNAPNNVGNIAGWIRGGYSRNGSAAVNFFTGQPALNYGFYQKDEGQSWQQDVNDEGPVSTRKEIIRIIEFWLSLGCDGFRVDMAGSLVKNDPESKGTIALWQEIFDVVKKDYPQAAFVSEWGEPDKSIIAGYDMDFLLHFGPSHYPDLFRTETPYFAGKGDIQEFFRVYMQNRKKTEGKGLICIPSGNHDMDRMAETLNPEQIKLAFAFLLTMPGAPFIYYGDELGMRKIHDLPSKEGGYHRTGSRTPMQWDNSANFGFSSAEKDLLYLPVDEEKGNVINAAHEAEDPFSVLFEVKRLITIRKEHPALSNTAEFELLYCKGYPLIYRRFTEQESLIIAINPSDQPCSFSLPAGEVIYSKDHIPFDPNILPAGSAFIISM
ncbi:MAG: alpha-amylase family glycosyl hydrolase [Bulleidia sp.]